jgi:hypothetical protein
MSQSPLARRPEQLSSYGTGIDTRPRNVALLACIKVLRSVMIVYHYDQATGAYLNTSSEADEDQMDQQFLIPAYATELVPPSPPNPNCSKRCSLRCTGVRIKPATPMIPNIDEAPQEGMWPRLSIKRL